MMIDHRRIKGVKKLKEKTKGDRYFFFSEANAEDFRLTCGKEVYKQYQKIYEGL